MRKIRCVLFLKFTKFMKTNQCIYNKNILQHFYSMKNKSNIAKFTFFFKFLHTLNHIIGEIHTVFKVENDDLFIFFLYNFTLKIFQENFRIYFFENVKNSSKTREKLLFFEKIR